MGAQHRLFDMLHEPMVYGTKAKLFRVLLSRLLNHHASVYNSKRVSSKPSVADWLSVSITVLQLYVSLFILEPMSNDVDDEGNTERY
jgi:hypothetical protein